MAPIGETITRAYSTPGADEFCTACERGNSPTARDKDAGIERASSSADVPARQFIRGKRSMQRRRSVSGPDDEMDCMFAAMSYAQIARAQLERSSSDPASHCATTLDADEPASAGQPDASEEQKFAIDSALAPSSDVKVVFEFGGLGKRAWRKNSIDAPMAVDTQLFKRCTTSPENEAFARGAASSSSSNFSRADTVSTWASLDEEDICPEGVSEHRDLL